MFLQPLNLFILSRFTLKSRRENFKTGLERIVENRYSTHATTKSQTRSSTTLKAAARQRGRAIKKPVAETRRDGKPNSCNENLHSSATWVTTKRNSANLRAPRRGRSLSGAKSRVNTLSITEHVRARASVPN